MGIIARPLRLGKNLQENHQVFKKKSPSALLKRDRDAMLTIPIQDKTQQTLHFHLKDG